MNRGGLREFRVLRQGCEDRCVQPFTFVRHEPGRSARGGVGFVVMFAALAGMSSASGCVTSGQFGPDDASTVFLPDGAPYVPTEGGIRFACVFEELATFTCPDLTLAAARVDDEVRRRRRLRHAREYDRRGIGRVSRRRRRTRMSREITTSCAAWEATGASLPVIDSGPPPVCAPSPVVVQADLARAAGDRVRVHQDAD